MSLVPTRLLIQQRLAAQLALLTFADSSGAEQSLNGAVFIGKNLIGVSNLKPLPILSILESPQADLAQYAGEESFMRKDYWTLLLSGAVEEDMTAPGTEAHYFAAAVQQHLYRIIETRSGGREGGAFPEEFMLGKLIASLEVAPPVVRLPEGTTVSAVGYFFLPIRVGIAVPFGQPFTEVADT